MTQSIEEQEPVTCSIEPHPDDFRTYSDSQLELRQELIDQKLALARQDGDDLVINWYEIEMISLQAERARRNGVNSYNSFNSYTVAEKKPVLDPEALHGLAGEIVNAIDPYTEADPVAVLTNTLTAFGNVVGPIPYFRVENTRHH